MKGTVTNVNIGPLVIEGILGDDGNLYVQVRGVASLFQMPQNHAARNLKAILGEGSSCPKISIQEDGANKRLNSCIALSDFERVLRHGRIAIQGRARSKGFGQQLSRALEGGRREKYGCSIYKGTDRKWAQSPTLTSGHW
jgi:hypothetical protein